MAEIFTYRTNDNVLLSAQRLADLLHCANHLMISGEASGQRHVGALIDIAADLAQGITNKLDLGEVSQVNNEQGVCNDR